MENGKKKIVCVIPAFNEEAKIGQVIDSVKPEVDQIVVVDDASSDRTYSIAINKNVTVLKHELNRGQGAALQTGNEKAIQDQADVIVHFDADGQFRPQDIRPMVRPISNEGFDIVFGSRFLGNVSNLPTFKKYFIYPLARIFNRIFIGSRLADPQNGFRAMSKEAAKEIRIENDGAAHCTEIQMKAHKYKLKIKEIPVTVYYNHYGQGLFKGKGRGAGGVRILKDILIAKLM